MGFVKFTILFASHFRLQSLLSRSGHRRRLLTGKATSSPLGRGPANTHKLQRRRDRPLSATTCYVATASYCRFQDPIHELISHCAGFVNIFISFVAVFSDSFTFCLLQFYSSFSSQPPLPSPLYFVLLYVLFLYTFPSYNKKYSNELYAISRFLFRQRQFIHYFILFQAE